MRNRGQSLKLRLHEVFRKQLKRWICPALKFRMLNRDKTVMLGQEQILDNLEYLADISELIIGQSNSSYSFLWGTSLNTNTFNSTL
jgi:hypothetical protein